MTPTSMVTRQQQSEGDASESLQDTRICLGNLCSDRHW